MTLIFATNNDNKVKEMQAAIGDAFHLITLREAGIDIDIPEPHDTLEANATEKSQTIYRPPPASTALARIPVSKRSCSQRRAGCKKRPLRRGRQGPGKKYGKIIVPAASLRQPQRQVPHRDFFNPRRA